eukprot:TRINITY_DN191_c0_g2_i1.p1 TRINITY_DN191_c0_g2~~TRINITY_DN191_c0_g2_i1.p1  ORF type:complete len:654 (-),score=184.62 TRINITY_DN191_c0_g2_i1:326-2047(-)
MPAPSNCNRFVSSDELALFGYMLVDTYQCDPATFKPPPPPGQPPSTPTDSPAPPSKSIAAEYGTAKFNHEWTKITFEHTFVHPVVFVGPLTFNGGDISVVRVKDVSPNSFMVKLTEAPNHDGTHTFESADWIVFEEGKYELDGCHNFEVGRVKTSKTLVPDNRGNFQNVFFTNHYETTPVVLTTIQTENDSHYVAVRQNKATVGSVKLALEREEANKNQHGEEIIGYVAFAQTRIVNFGKNLQVSRTNAEMNSKWHPIHFDDYSSKPFFIASLSTYYGADPAHLRKLKSDDIDQISVKVEEDQSNDDETNHTREVVSYIAIELANKNQHGEEIIGYVAFAQTRIVNFGKNLQVSRTNAEMNSKWHPIHFDDYSSKPFFIASLSTYYGADPAHLRKLKSDDIDQISVKVEEDQSNDDETNHTREVVSYIAIESTGSRQGRGYLYATPGTGVTSPVPVPPTNLPPSTEATESSAPSYTPSPTPGGNNSEVGAPLPGSIIFALVFLMFLTFILAVLLVFIVLYVRKKLPSSGGYARVMGNLLGEPLDGDSERVTLDEEGSSATPVSFPFDDSSESL